MAGDQFVSLAAVVVGVAAVNLAVLWLLVRRNRDPAEPSGSATTRPSDPEDEAVTVGPGSVPTSPGNAADPTGEAGDRREPPALDADGETAVCRHCGAENRAGYRYCRWCVRSGVVDEEAGGASGAGLTDRPL